MKNYTYQNFSYNQLPIKNDRVGEEKIACRKIKNQKFKSGQNYQDFHSYLKTTRIFEMIFNLNHRVSISLLKYSRMLAVDDNKQDLKVCYIKFSAVKIVEFLSLIGLSMNVYTLLKSLSNFYQHRNYPDLRRVLA